jgi:hypothetical protein
LRCDRRTFSCGRQLLHRLLHVVYRGPKRFGVVVADGSEQTPQQRREDVAVLAVQSESAQLLDVLVGEGPVSGNDGRRFGL